MLVTFHSYLSKLRPKSTFTSLHSATFLLVVVFFPPFTFYNSLFLVILYIWLSIVHHIPHVYSWGGHAHSGVYHTDKSIESVQRWIRCWLHTDPLYLCREKHHCHVHGCLQMTTEDLPLHGVPKLALYIKKVPKLVLKTCVVSVFLYYIIFPTEVFFRLLLR